MTTRLQDDLYEAINGETIAKLEIPGDRPVAGGFSELDMNVEKLMLNEFAAFAKGEKTTDIKEMMYAVEMYKKYVDVDTRNKLGVKPVMPILNKIKNLKDVDDLNKHALEIELEGASVPFSFGVEPDSSDATKNSFIILGPSIILPDTTYYDEANQAGKQLLEVWKNMAKSILAYTDLSDSDKDLYLEDTLKFDLLISKKVKSQLEWADYVKNYNPMKVEDVANYMKPFDFKGFLKSIYKDNIPEEVIVYDPKAIKEMNGYFNEENFTLYKHWCYVQTLVKSTSLLSEDLVKLGYTYKGALYGITEIPVLEKRAYQFVSSMYAEPIGVYYGRTYFGEEAKKDVVSLVKKIIETYKMRVKKNNFLEEKTKEKAILKLSTIVIKMGYPDFVNEVYSKLVVDKDSSFFDSATSVRAKLVMNNLEKLYKPVDRSEWAMPGHMVNACYNPSANDITFPAAILQKPFYSIDQTISQNLGGIGAVIGHEISHAFDNNGAQFDEKGNLSNWWTERDYQGFKESTQKMIEQFDGIPFHGGKVKGELVVSENIADNGGVAVTLEIMHNIKNANFKEYFENWARIWCQKAREEYILLLLNNDVHSPAKLRANITPRNFPEWYETFGVTEKDQMYIEPSKRIIIW